MWSQICGTKKLVLRCVASLLNAQPLNIERPQRSAVWYLIVMKTRSGVTPVGPFMRKVIKNQNDYVMLKQKKM